MANRLESEKKRSWEEPQRLRILCCIRSSSTLPPCRRLVQDSILESEVMVSLDEASPFLIPERESLERELLDHVEISGGSAYSGVFRCLVY